VKYELKYNEIAELIRDFYNVTGCRTGIFDKHGKIVLEYPEECCDFCAHIRESEKGFEKCRICDHSGIMENRQRRYRCHAGLWEVVIPISDENETVAYLMFGQFLFSEDLQNKIKECKELTKEYFTSELFDEKIKSVKLLSENMLKSIEKIFSACISYIITNKMINRQRENLWDEVLAYIDLNITDKIYLNEMAEALNVSVSSICKRVKREKNKTLTQIIIEKKMEYAKELLKNKDVSISSVANDVGMDHNYFSREFKKIVGVSPSEYKRMR